MKTIIKVKDFKSVTIPDMCEELGRSEVVQNFLKGRRLYCAVGDWLEAVATHLIMTDKDFCCDFEGRLTRRSIFALSSKGREKVLNFWEEKAKQDFVNPDALFYEIMTRDNPERDFELPSFDSKSGNPELLTFKEDDFIYD